jgi:hypothetical protein
MACWARELGFHDDELVSQKSEAVKAGEGCGANNEDVANDLKLEFRCRIYNGDRTVKARCTARRFSSISSLD